MRALHFLAAGFVLALAMFVATMLVAPPTSQASIASTGSPTAGPAICDVLPSGDIANCTIQN